MAPKPSPPKKKGSPKKKKLAVKADYGGVFFGEQEPATSRENEEEEEDDVILDDPMASYRAAAAAAKEALAKERAQEEAMASLFTKKLDLFNKIFDAMDSDHDGKVDMAEVVERVSAGTAQLSSRAKARRPEGSVALQLPMVFTKDEWHHEMMRILRVMDEATFEANVMGLFECFRDDPKAPVVLGPVPGTRPPSNENGAPAEANGAAPTVGPKLDRDALLRALFQEMDAEGDGVVTLRNFLTQAKSDEEANELRSLFHFINTHFGGSQEALTFEAFRTGTLERTPLGNMKDSSFASAVRGMTSDVKQANAMKRSAGKRLGLLQELFSQLERGSKQKGAIDVNAFVSTAKSEAEKEELKTTFKDFDAAVDGAEADGQLTFRKFAHGTMKRTPLGQMSDAAFEKRLAAMIIDAKETAAVAPPAPADIS